MNHTDNYRIETLQLHAGQEHTDASGARAVPIHQSAAYVFEDCNDAAERFALHRDGYIYSRLNNPTQAVLEERLRAMEGGTGAVATATGAAAVFYALQNILRPGDHVIAADNLYGGTYNLIVNTLADMGVIHTIVDMSDPEALRAAFRPETRAVYAETFGNPNSDVTDIEAVAAEAHAHGVPLIIDNTFGTPVLMRPIEHGADVVVHSATKFIGGHGTTLGGVVIDGGSFPWTDFPDKYPTIARPDANYHGSIFAEIDPAAPFAARVRAVLLRDTGACLSALGAFLLLQGVETLSLRVERHVANALKVVEFLASHPKVAKVNHPSLPHHRDHELYLRYYPNGAGSIFTFEVKGGRDEAWRFIDSLKLFSHLANVADMKSLVIHPATTTHSQLSPEELAQQHITPATVRVSIGTEHIDDIIADLQQALDKI